MLLNLERIKDVDLIIPFFKNKFGGFKFEAQRALKIDGTLLKVF